MTEEPGAGTAGAEPQDEGQEPRTPEPEPAGGKEPESAPTIDPAELAAKNARLTRLHEEHLREKSNLEAERQRYREMEAAQGNNQPPASQAQLYEEMQALIQDASTPDSVLRPYARVIGTIMMQNQQLQQSINERFGLMEVAPEKRPEVQRVVKEARERGENISHATAASLIDARAYAGKSEELSQREKKLAEREAAIKAGTISTREMPAAPDPSKLKTITQAELGKRMAALEAKGEFDAASDLYRRSRSGDLTVT